MDTSFGLHGYPVDYDMINHVINGGINNKGPHPILIKLLANDRFKSKFINWFMDRFNSDFHYEILKGILDTMVTQLSPYIPEHRSRWGMNEVYDWLSWKYNINIIYNFIEQRQEYIIEHLINEFDIDGLVNIDISINNGGIVQLNTLKIENVDSQSIWSGKYFKSIDISLHAIPNDGYVFDGWEGDIASISDSVNLSPITNLFINAKFSPSKVIRDIYINEIQYLNDNNIAIEVFNASSHTVFTDDLYFTDNQNILLKNKLAALDSTFSQIKPNEYKVLNISNKNTLNQNGKYLAIAQISGNDTIIVDSVLYPILSGNISYGRYPDASNNWKYLPYPTLGHSNDSIVGNSANYTRSSLIRNYPNPFAISTIIPVFISDDSSYEVKIFDVNGINIKNYSITSNFNGVTTIIWDGIGLNNKFVSSGIYFCTLFRNDKLIDTIKMLFLK